MSGHNKWSSIKHQKGIADAKRGQLFTKLSREIILAVKQGGGNPDGNARLRLAIQKAKDASMPNDNIKRCIEKGLGTADGAQMFEAVFEGYGPGGSALMIEVLGDNRNRAVQEIRSALSRSGGNLGENGSVSWKFVQHGIISIDGEGLDEDEFMMQALDAGAEDVSSDDGFFEVVTAPGDLESVRKTLEDAGIKIDSAEVSLVPTTYASLDEKTALQVLKLIDKLEETGNDLAPDLFALDSLCVCRKLVASEPEYDIVVTESPLEAVCNSL